MPTTDRTRPDTRPRSAPPDEGRVAGTPSSSPWRAPWVRPVLAVAVVVGWSVVVGLVTPRGPQTTGEALTSIAVSLLVGGVAGWAWRSRWTIVAAPFVFACVVEVVRLDVVGPSVDMVQTSTYGMFALVSGRVVHGLLSLLPLGLGAALGAAMARRRLDGEARSRLPGRIATGVAVLSLLALVVGLLRPASTAPIVGPDGEPLPDSIAELTTVEVDGREHGLMIRGHDLDNPVMLFLAGGPGGSEYGAMRNHLSALEEHVTVVTWDQRGTGTSYDALDPTGTYTLDSAVQDTITVTEHLRDRFDQDRILLAGQSWGTTLGVLAVQRAPQLYAGFVGSGQMVSQLETDLIMYDDTLAWARDTGRDGLAARLVEIGPPPYDRMLHYEPVLGNPDVYPYDHSGNSEGAGAWSENLIVREYGLLDQLHLLAAFLDTYSVLYPQLQEIDLRETATSFDVPMFFVQGAHEARGRAELFADWYPMIDAPTRDVVTLRTSGHRPLWEQPDEFVRFVTESVLPITHPRSSSVGQRPTQATAVGISSG